MYNRYCFLIYPYIESSKRTRSLKRPYIIKHLFISLIEFYFLSRTQIQKFFALIKK